MAVNLVGNIDGRSYNPPTIDLFAEAKKQNNRPVLFGETEIGKENLPISVEISAEGLRALHGSMLKGAVDIRKGAEEIKYLSEHQPIESFTNRFSRMMPRVYLQLAGSGTSVAQAKANELIGALQSICKEVVSGYENGNRIRFREDAASTDGFVKISKEEELSILLNEFSAFVESRFGRQYQEEARMVFEQTKDIQQVRRSLGLDGGPDYEPLQIPDGFVEKLIRDAERYMESI